ncbi:DUF2125 domain-containing protein [Psychromarinibacter sp. C21-152]|uniref:DUF2125 domain-containing protein n=1 Tax=Psychromarinibacter sediminicola TaxID=3033385 RepID=A0AAE3NQP8_9RHOB|nr:DUF2125 domain-containing protein [Psychromarinibacter sediminicola]MDF0600709.1 DUF2125 domain-containing protein [Psychromarinibacter sediminicola]
MLRFRFLTGTAACALLPAAALADVTPEDVWDNLTASVAPLGGETTAETARDGDVLTLHDIEMRFGLPMGLGEATLSLGTLTLTDNGDGTVALGGPNEQDWRLGVDIPGAGGGTVTMTLRVEDYTTTASGDPGDVTYDYDIGRYAVTFADASLHGQAAEEAPEFSIDGTMTMNDLSGQYTLREAGELFTIVSEGAIGSGGFDFAFETTDPDSGETVAVDQTAALREMGGAGEVALPAGGVTLTALAEALRDGMALEYEFYSDGQENEQVITAGGTVVTRQTDSVGRNQGSVHLAADGIRVAGSAVDYDLAMEQPGAMPVPLSVAFDTVEAEFAMPLLTSEEPSTAVLRGAATGVTLGEALWSLFDPQQELPRDPATLSVDVTAGLRPTVDLVDIEALQGLEATGAAPFDLYDVTVAELSVSAAGASAAAEGAFTFDNDDLETFDGIPAPDGSATLRLSGVNGLLDALVALHLLSEDDAMGTRMMLGGFAQPDGEDGYVSDIVVDGETGRVTAGGQRIR